MSSCFTKTTDEVVYASDYTTLKKRKQVYQAMARSLAGGGAMSYLHDNRNYKVMECSGEYILAQSHSHAANLDMVRGAKYNGPIAGSLQHPGPIPQLPVPMAAKYKSSLGNFLQRTDSALTSAKDNCGSGLGEYILPAGLLPPAQYQIPTRLESTEEYRQAVRAQPSAGLYLHDPLPLTCPADDCDTQQAAA